MTSIKSLATRVDKTIKIPIFTFWGAQFNQEIHWRSCFLIFFCLVAHKSSYFSWLVLHYAQHPYAKWNLRMFSLLLVDSSIGLVYCAEGTRHLFKGFFGHVLLNHYFLGFWKGLCGWLGFFLLLFRLLCFLLTCPYCLSSIKELLHEKFSI